jgi:hypothetical protein
MAHQVLLRRALYSAAPVKLQVWSQNSTQQWFPPSVLFHRAVPTARAGTPTERSASTRNIDIPVHEAVHHTTHHTFSPFK